MMTNEEVDAYFDEWKARLAAIRIQPIIDHGESMGPFERTVPSRGQSYRPDKRDMDLGHERYSKRLGTYIPAWEPWAGQDPQLFR